MHASAAQESVQGGLWRAEADRIWVLTRISQSAIACRFDVWPYLEQFAYDAAIELQEELGEKPDFCIGNYSDGNLVATLIAQHMQASLPSHAASGASVLP